MSHPQPQNTEPVKAALHSARGPAHPKLEAFSSCMTPLGIAVSFIPQRI